MTEPKPVLLVVDDEPGIVRLVAGVARKIGFEVDTAGSGHEAMAKLETDKAAVALVDRRMPDVDGLEVLRRIRAKVTDTGAGIPPEKVKLLFQPFEALPFARAAEELRREAARGWRRADLVATFLDQVMTAERATVERSLEQTRSARLRFDCTTL